MKKKHHHVLLALGWYDPDEKIETIAGRCGYPSLNAFFTAFKQSTGCTPAEFRRGQRVGS